MKTPHPHEATAGHTLSVSDDELRVLLDSLDLFSRFCQGQLERFVELNEGRCWQDEHDEATRLQEAVGIFKHVLWGIEPNAFLSIDSENVPRLGREAYTLYKRLRQPALATSQREKRQ